MIQINESNINQILADGENAKIEFKISFTHPNIIERVICAFTNTEGGAIIFGYDERNKEIVGVESHRLNRLRQYIEHSDFKNHCNISTVVINDKTLVVLNIEKADSVQFVKGVEYTRIEGQVYSKIRNIRSKHLRDFIKEIQYNNRNPQDTKALALLKNIHSNPERKLPIGTLLYRCRLIKDVSKVENKSPFFGYGKKDSFIPPISSTRDMRANYRYIPYLYCANHPYTALVEVRPRLGSNVSLATISVEEELTLLDFTLSYIPKNMDEAKQNLFADLSMLFSKPVTAEDDILDYIPTQYISEYVKHLDYDGIIFRSSLTPELDDKDATAEEFYDRYNVVVFNYKKCTPVKSNVVNITRNYFEYKQIDDDPMRIKNI